MQRAWERWQIVFAAVVVAAGLALKFRLAVITYLNPDEAYHVLMTFHGWRATLREAWGDAHPPLLALITHAVSRVSRGEVAMRLAPILAGSCFPVLMCIWLRRVSGTLAGLTALFLLTLSPNLIALGAEVRSYTLAAAFVAASLVAFEQALDGRSWRAMALFSALLWGAILSDYSVLPFAGAAGIYALMRLGGAPRDVKITWAAGQCAALGLLAFLYKAQIQGYVSDAAAGASSTWLLTDFPHGATTLTFPLVNTAKLFAYMLSSNAAGVVGVAAFAAVVACLWTGRAGIERGKSRSLAILLVAPLVLGIAGAYARHFPYGKTRHAMVIGVIGVAAIAILFGSFPRRIAIATLWIALLLTPVWVWKTEPAQQITSDRNRKKQILECLNYMRAAIPPNVPVLADYETLLVLAYYEGADAFAFSSDVLTEETLGGRWRVVTRGFHFAWREEYEQELAEFRNQYGFGANEPVWVLDGGFTVVTGPPDESRPFTKAVRIFQAGR